MADDPLAPYRRPPVEVVAEPRPYSVYRLAALVLGLPGLLLVATMVALLASGHIGGAAAAGSIAAGAVQLVLAAALWQRVPASRPAAVLLMLVWAGLLLALADDRAAPPLLLPAVLAIALLLPLPGRTSARLRAAVARGRAAARPGSRGALVAWSLPAASLLLIAQGVWQAVSTVAGLVRSAANPGIGAALDTAGRVVLAAVEVPLELLVFPLVGVFVLSGGYLARRLAVLLELLVLVGSLLGRFETTRAQVSSAIAVLVLLLLLLHERAATGLPSRR
jgi:hypothetical protein